MTKLKKLRLKLYGVIALALALGVVGVFGGVKAYQSYNSPKVVIENVENYNEAVSEAPVEEPNIGAVTGPALPNPNCANDLCTWVVVAPFIEASSTFVSVQDPFTMVTSSGTGGNVLFTSGGVGWTGASTTIDLVRLYQTGAATSSYGVACGPSTGPTAAGIVVAKTIVTTTVGGVIAIPTSTLGVLENNMTAAQGNRATGGTVAKVMMGPSDPYFVCLADPNVDGAGGIAGNGDSAFAGYAVIRFSRFRR